MKNELIENENINDHFVEIFNLILVLEEKSLKKKGIIGLSLVEIHVIEAVIKLGSEATMKTVAKELKISLSSLSVSTNVLIKKGYLIKIPSKLDKRVRHLKETSKSLEINKIHVQWHKEFVDNALINFDNEQRTILLGLLKNLNNYLQINLDQ